MIRSNGLWQLIPALPLLLAAVMPAFADSESTLKAEALLEKAALAYGGRDAWESKGVLVIHETQTRYEDDGERVVELVHYLDTRGRGYRLERQAGADRQVFGWDGSAFWAIENARPGDGELLNEARRVISDAFYRFSLPFILAGSGAGLEYIGTDEVAGMPTEVVKVTYAGDPAGAYFQSSRAGHERHAAHGEAADAAEAGHSGGHHGGNQVYFYHFDAGYRIARIYFSHHGDGSFESLYPGDYRELDGILLERARTLVRPDGRKHYDSEFTRMEFRDMAEEGLFSQPRG